MPLLTPLWMQRASGDPMQYDARLDRAGLIGALFTREGVINPEYGNLRLDQRAEGANFSIDVFPGYVVVQGDDISDQGLYICSSTTKVNIATPAKPTSGTRTHRVIARVRDSLANSGWGTSLDWTIEILQDSGTGLPALPPSAVHLGSFVMTSTMSSVQTANITTDPARATVGSLDRRGTFDFITPDYSAQDSARPPRWSINSDNWVSLAGFLRFTKGVNAPVYGGQTYSISKTALPVEIRPSGFRDFIGIASFGFVHYAINPQGLLTYRIFGDLTLVHNSSWWSFDSCGYRL